MTSSLQKDWLLCKGLLSSAKDSILTKGLRPYKRTSSLQKDFVLTKGLLSSAKDWHPLQRTAILWGWLRPFVRTDSSAKDWHPLQRTASSAKNRVLVEGQGPCERTWSFA
jgi:hypothetical protein